MTAVSVHDLVRPTYSVMSTYAELCEHVAARISRLVERKPDAVLGLATGSTPLGVYEALVRRHQAEGLDFSHVTCFNLDEYFPMEPGDPHSYHAFMQANLFRHLNCRRWHVPDGRQHPGAETSEQCRRYEAAITEAGGIDFQLLGIGRTGHIGFNEPGSPADSRTRLVTLHPTTRDDAARDFGGIANVPTQAVSMGIGTILDAREVVLMASGPGKAEIVRQAMQGEITEQVPASLVRRHPQAHFCFDAEAAHLLEFAGERTIRK